MAEGLLKYRVSQEGLDEFEIYSAGTVAITGLTASEKAVEVAAEKGVDISSHRSKPLTRSLIQEAELILGMEPAHVEYADSLGGGGKTYLISGYPGDGGAAVPDPIGGSLSEYRYVFDMLDEEVQRIIPHLAKIKGKEKRLSDERE
jgi:protein-tyrosine-phosphatase